MPNTWDLQIDSFGISRNRYRELKYFCRRYGEMQAELATIRDLSSSGMDGMPHGSDITNPTAQKAERAMQLHTNCHMIEVALQAAAPEFKSEMMRNVCLGLRFEQVNPPCGRNQFYSARRKFFWMLDQLKQD